MDDSDIIKPNSDFDIGVEEVIYRMSEIWKKMFDETSDNIKQAQLNYKKI